MNIQKIKKGFTLAEVLITLLIIGIVASLVIPALINDTQEAEYNVGVKKAQAELSNAIKMIQINNGGTINVGNGNTNADTTLLRDEFCNVMLCIQKGSRINIFGPIKYKYYKSLTSYTISENSDDSGILNNGNLIFFGSYNNCNNYGINACGGIWIDINGKKQPNMIGKDLYPFWITRQNGNGAYLILPRGMQGDTYSQGCIAGTTNWQETNGCTAKRLIDPEHMP